MKTAMLLILCWSTIGLITAKELSKKVLDFLTYITGDLDNRAHIKLKGNVYDLVQVRVRRVRVDALDQVSEDMSMNEPDIVCGASYQRVMTFFHLGVVTDGPDNTVTMKLYNFTEFSNLKFGSYNLDKISKVKLEQLQSDDGCVATFKVVGKGLMTGNYPNCRYTDNGKHPYLIINYTCDFDTAVYPVNTDQKYMTAPYVFRHRPARDSLEDAPEDYVNPCGY